MAYPSKRILLIDNTEIVARIIYTLESCLVVFNVGKKTFQIVRKDSVASISPITRSKQAKR